MTAHNFNRDLVSCVKCGKVYHYLDPEIDLETSTGFGRWMCVSCDPRPEPVKVSTPAPYVNPCEECHGLPSECRPCGCPHVETGGQFNLFSVDGDDPPDHII